MWSSSLSAILPSSENVPVWFFHPNKTSLSPLPKKDCAVLNEALLRGESICSISYGRRKVDLKTLVSTTTYWDSPPQPVCYSSWFTTKNGVVTGALSPSEAATCEALYLQGVDPSKNLYDLPGPEGRKIVVTEDPHNLTVYTLKLRLQGFFTSDVQLQRGFCDYTVPGEIEEDALGPLRKVIFVVHGIGENLWSKEGNAMPSLVEQTDKLRVKLLEQQHKKFLSQKRDYDDGNQQPPDRIEVLPIEWFSKIHSSSSNLMKSLDAVTIRSIPMLRTIANELVFDVLMYQSPSFCEEVLKCVASKMNTLSEEIMLANDSDNIEFGIVGHSLGSVITFDLLAISDKSEGSFPLPHLPSDSQIPPLSFAPSLKAVFLLGSPVGFFLTLRETHSKFASFVPPNGSHNTFSFSSTFPRASIYNVFNISDPVAYRIEPLLMPIHTEKKYIQNPADLPSATAVLSKGVKIHTHVKNSHQHVQKGVEEGMKKLHLIKNTLSAATKAGSLTNAFEQISKNIGEVETEIPAIKNGENFTFALANNTDERLDYAIQSGVLSNDYLSSISAHNDYLGHEDIIHFLHSETCNDNDNNDKSAEALD